MKLTRREAREAAFLLTYQRTVRCDTMEELFDSVIESESFDIDDFTRESAITCDEHLEEIDAVIERNMDNWKINRLPRLTLAALRLSVSELLYREDIPVAVTINEMLEVLKKYASEEDASFINGVLGAVVKNEQIVKTDAEEEKEDN